MWKIYLFHTIIRVLLPLFGGGLIYILFGDKGIRLVDWSLRFGVVEQLREQVSFVNIPNWMLFNLTDGLWLFALLQLIDMIWQNEKGGSVWVILCVMLAVGHELGQLIGYFSGTFDLLDILSYCIVTILSVLLNKFLT